MSLIRYRRETDPALKKAAETAYAEAPPQHNPRISMFARNLGRGCGELSVIAELVREADQRKA